VPRWASLTRPKATLHGRQQRGATRLWTLVDLPREEYEMFMMHAEDLAEVWIRLHHLPKESSEHDALFWSWEKLTKMCNSAPESAWNVIQEIIALDHSDQILANVGAGRLLRI
jgi:hypothetical protein